MILWILVILSVFISGLALASLDANAEIRAMSAEIYRKHGLNRSAPAGCLIALSALANIGLWVTYAIQVGDWRFAAIPLFPWLVGSVAIPLHKALTKNRRQVSR